MKVDITSLNTYNLVDLICPNVHYAPIWTDYIKTIVAPLQTIIDNAHNKLVNIENFLYYNGTIIGINTLLNDIYDNSQRRIYCLNNVIPENDDVYLINEPDGTPLDVYLIGELDPLRKDIYLKNESSSDIGEFSIFIPAELYDVMSVNTFAEIRSYVTNYIQFNKTFSILRYE